MALAAGARVVAAHGTHAVAPVERRGEAVIAWGLGNLLFSCECSRETEGVVLRVALAGERTDASVIPIEAGLDGAPAQIAGERGATLELLEAIGSPALRREGAAGAF
jgi:poly-gamma-glutamate capsule biosynthesis protein CapA/YwtB (metallophosphatase superfamily)